MGIELFIRDTNYFFFYKQLENGDFINKYFKIKDNIFNLDGEIIIKEIHENFYGDDNYLNYMIKIPKGYIRDYDFYEVIMDVNDYIEIYHKDFYGDKYATSLAFYVDLIDRRIEDIGGDNEIYDDIDDDCGCLDKKLK
jgi:hypothetical protein